MTYSNNRAPHSYSTVQSSLTNVHGIEGVPQFPGGMAARAHPLALQQEVMTVDLMSYEHTLIHWQALFKKLAWSLGSLLSARICGLFAWPAVLRCKQKQGTHKPLAANCL